MKKSKIILLAILTSSSLALTGCNTVKGAFQGAGEDTKAVAHQLQLDDNHSRHHQSKQVTASTVSTTSQDASTAMNTGLATTPPAAIAKPGTPPPLSPSGD